MKKYIGVAFILVIMACNPTENKSTETKDTISAKNVDSNVLALSFKDDKVEQIYTDYVALKNALVASNADDAKAAAKMLTVSLKAYAGCENTAISKSKLKVKKANKVYAFWKLKIAAATHTPIKIKLTNLSDFTTFKLKLRQW